MPSIEFDPGTEFDRQLQTLVDRGMPALSGMPEPAFVRLVSPLRELAVANAPAAVPTRARVPFVLVITKELVPAHRTMSLTELTGRPGFADFTADDLGRFDPIADLSVPGGPAYLVFDVDRGAETRNFAPDKAMVEITAQRRTPITVDEGISFITQYPDSLEKNNCFSLVGSRCGDRRVPALWISNRAPKLGWCWAGNPHTWLGSASCADRVGLT